MKWRNGEYTIRQLDLETHVVAWKLGMKYIATSFLDHSIKLWYRANLECVETLHLNDNFVTSFQFEENQFEENQFEENQESHLQVANPTQCSESAHLQRTF
jgi:hypothetical protein